MESLNSPPSKRSHDQGLNSASPFPDFLAMSGLQNADSMDIPRLLTMLKRRALVIFGVTAVVVGFTASKTFSESPVYQSQFQMLVEPVNADNELSDLTQSLGNVAGGSAKSSSLDYETQIQVLRSPALMDEILKQLQATYPSLSYGDLIGNLTIVRPGDTKILEVKYQDTDPSKIQTILDTLAQAYLQYSLIERQTNLRQGIQFIDEQMPDLRARFDQLQSELQRFRQTYNFVDPESMASQITEGKTALAQQKQVMQEKIAFAGSYYNSLQDQYGGLAALQDSPTYQNLIQELRGVEVQIAAESTRFKPGNINIKLLKQKRDNLIPVIREEARRILGTKLAATTSELRQLQTGQQNLAQTEIQLQQETENLAVLTRRYTDMQRELQVANEALNRFMENRQALQVKAAQTEIPWQIIDAPVKPTFPISPNIPRNLVLGLVGGILSGLGVAMLLEKLDRVYHTIDDVKRDTKLPVLGQLPMSSELADQAQSSLSRLGASLKRLWPARFSPFTPAGYGGYYGYGGGSSFLEAMRILYSNLQLLSSDRPIRSITISSSMPGDGKSTVSTYLAQTAASMGKNVLLIDADLRRPQVHNRMNLNNEQGLSDLLTSEITAQAILAGLKQMPGLTILTAGTIPPDPVRLLSSKKMQELMQVFASHYDLVIYDMPPLVGLADVSAVANQTDGLMLVMRMAKTDREALRHAIDNLNLGQIPTLGLVVNAMPRSATSGYTYYQYQPKEDLGTYVPDDDEQISIKR